MADVEASLKQLLNGEVVPVSNGVDLQIKSTLSDELERPLVKRTVTYIVMAMVFDDWGRVILIQEAKESCKGKWYPPAGRVEPGENLIDAAKREVLEESGIEFEPVSVIDFETNQWQSRWFRLCYVGTVAGGKLKTLDQKDSESLQAGWFSVDAILNGEVSLRHNDFFKSLDLARQYLGSSPDRRHPPYAVGIQPYQHMIHRPVIVRKRDSGSVEVLCNTRKGCLPCCGANPHDSLSATVTALFVEAFGLKAADGFPKLKLKGLLTLEHCGVPAWEHDGLCITTVYKLPKKQHQKVDKPSHSDYAWILLTDGDLIDHITKRALSKNKLLIPII